MTWRHAWADLLASSPDPESLDQAVRLEPDNPQFLIAQSTRDLFAANAGSDRAKQELTRALEQNPRNSEALMELGLIAESSGNVAEAERLLREAETLDKSFKPGWTLANFYYRTNQIEKMWPEIRKALEVTTRPKLMFFDVSGVYDLCWRAGGNSRQILSMVPDRPQALLTYFVYSVLHNHLDAAAEIYARVLPAVDSSVQMYRDVFAMFCNLLFQAHRIGEAVDVWNRMVAKGLVASTALDPQKAESIANPDFAQPFDPAPFGWFAPDNPHVGRTWAPRSVWFEFDGQQREQVSLLQKNFPVMPDRDYVLTWTADGSRISRPADPGESGLSIRFFAGEKTIAAHCSFFLAKRDRSCTFHIPTGVETITMNLQVERLAGSVRLRGALQISRFQLEIQAIPPAL